MKPFLALVLVLAFLAGCGGTLVPTEPPPTQTPWIVVVTATAGSQSTSEMQATATLQPTGTTRATATTKAAAATPGATQEASGSPEVTSTTTASPPAQPSRVPTQGPTSGAMLYPPPVLLEPPQRQPVSWGSTALLIWSPVGELEEDEYYHVHLERRPVAVGQDWYGDYVYTKETQFRAEVGFLAPFHPPANTGEATVYWWVRVVQKTGQDENGKPMGVDISPYSEERTLILDPKP